MRKQFNKNTNHDVYENSGAPFNENENNEFLQNLANQAAAKSDDANIQLEAVKKIREILCCGTKPPIDAVINTGVVPTLVQCLTTDNEPLQHEAAWILTNIASGNIQQTKSVVDAGAIPYFIKLLDESKNNNSEIICDQALVALENITTNFIQHKFECCKNGLIHLLAKLITPEASIIRLQNVLLVLSNFCESSSSIIFREYENGNGNNSTTKTTMASEIISIFSKLIQCQDLQILQKTFQEIVAFSDKGIETQNLIIEANLYVPLVAFLGHQDSKILSKTLDVLINLVSGEDFLTQRVLDSGLLNSMEELLIKNNQNNNKKIQKKILILLSNITAGNKQQLQQFFDSGLIPVMIEFAKVNDDPKLQREVAYVLCNALVTANNQQIQYLINSGIVPCLCGFLENSDPEVPKVVLGEIAIIVERLGTTGRNQELQQKIAESVQNLANAPFPINSEFSKLANESLEKILFLIGQMKID